MCMCVLCERITNPIQNRKETEHAEDKEPEPEKHIDLLVHDVQRQYADGVVPLDFPADAVLVESALGHPWKHVNHWVHSVLLIGLHEFEYVDAEGQEGAVEKAVHQKHLTCDNVLVALQFFCSLPLPPFSFSLSLLLSRSKFNIYNYLFSD